MSRRTALGSVAALGGIGVIGMGAHRIGVLDEGLRAVGVRPHAEPDPRDVQLLAEAAAAQQTLIADLDALMRRHAVNGLDRLRTVLVEQRAAVSDRTETSGTATASNDKDAALSEFSTKVAAAARARRDAALSSGSLAVTQVLAGMAAGLSQVERSVQAMA
jgi:hypothetical protein